MSGVQPLCRAWSPSPGSLKQQQSAVMAWRMRWCWRHGGARCGGSGGHALEEPCPPGATLTGGAHQAVLQRPCGHKHISEYTRSKDSGTCIWTPMPLNHYISDMVSGPNQQALSQTTSRHGFRVSTGQRPFPISTSCLAALFWWIMVFNSMSVASWPQGQ